MALCKLWHSFSPTGTHSCYQNTSPLVSMYPLSWFSSYYSSHSCLLWHLLLSPTFKSAWDPWSSSHSTRSFSWAHLIPWILEPGSLKIQLNFECPGQNTLPLQLSLFHSSPAPASQPTMPNGHTKTWVISDPFFPFPLLLTKYQTCGSHMLKRWRGLLVSLTSLLESLQAKHRAFQLVCSNIPISPVQSLHNNHTHLLKREPDTTTPLFKFSVTVAFNKVKPNLAFPAP